MINLDTDTVVQRIERAGSHRVCYLAFLDAQGRVIDRRVLTWNGAHVIDTHRGCEGATENMAALGRKFTTNKARERARARYSEMLKLA